jgi:hypothetical protein
VRRFQKIDVNEPSIEDAIEIMKGLKPYFEEYHKLRYSNDAIKAAVELSARYISRPQAAGQGDRRDRRNRCGPDAAAPVQARKLITEKEIEATIATMARIPPKSVSKDDEAVLANLEKELRSVVYGQDIGHRSAVDLDQAGPCRPARAEQADRLLRLLRPDRRRQDRSRQAAGLVARRRAPALRHVGIHGAAHGLASARRTSRLCRLRPGRSADRWRRPASALRGSARRNREGASGPVQHPVAGHGSRHADRPQRQEDRLPQRHPDHDDQCGAHRKWPRRPSASVRPSGRARTRKR